MIISALNERPMPVYGKGNNVRGWLHVDDRATTLLKVLNQGKLGESYIVGGDAERSNLDVVKTICTLIDEA
jgi:dTDP-glucose 4,6-dehydratase